MSCCVRVFGFSEYRTCCVGGFVPSTAEQHLNSCDAIAFGRWFLANPDLPQRIKVRFRRNFDTVVKCKLVLFFGEFGARLCHC